MHSTSENITCISRSVLKLVQTNCPAVQHFLKMVTCALSTMAFEFVICTLSYSHLYLNLKIRDVCKDFEPCFKVHNLVSVQLKSNKFGQIANLDTTFYVVACPFIDWLKFETHPSSLCNFRRNGLLLCFLHSPGLNCQVIM